MSFKQFSVSILGDWVSIIADLVLKKYLITIIDGLLRYGRGVTLVDQSFKKKIATYKPGFLNLGSAAPFLGFRVKIKNTKNILAQMIEI